MAHSQHQLEALAKNNPKELIRIITSPNSDAHTLTFGAELLGELEDESLVLPALRKLLKHAHALVREGAIYGVTNFYTKSKPPAEIIERLQHMAEHDPSPACKTCASDLVAELAK
jgi:vesicle coat complex subunit